MPIRNWGGGGDHSDTFIALQDEFMRRAQAAQAARSGGGGSRRRSGGGGGSGGSGSRSVHDGAGVIVDGMSRGSTNWRNLYAYYTSQLRRTPKSSPIYAQVQRQIDNIEMIAEANGIVITGGKVPDMLSEAEPGTNRYQKRDALTPQVDAMINDQILYLMATRNGIYPGNERPMQSYVGRVLYDGTVAELREGMIADAKMQEELMQDILDGSTTIMDPVSGVYMEVTPDFTMDLIYQYNENQLALAGLERGLGEDGDFAGRISTWEGVQQSLIAPLVTRHVFPSVDSEGNVANPNTKGIAGYLDQSLLQFNVLKNMALQSSDPMDVLKNMQSAGRSLLRTMREADNFINNMPEGFEVEEFVREDIQFSMQLAEFLTQAPTMNPEGAMQAASELMANHPGDNFFLSRTEIEHIVGNWADEVGTVGERGSALEGRISPGWYGVGGALAAIDGININQMARSSQEVAVGAEQYVWVAPYGQSAPVAVPASAAAQYLQSLGENELFEGGLAAGAFPSIENVRGPNGRSMTTVVWREKQPPSDENVMWWTKEVKNGNRTEQVWATMADFEQFGGDRLLAAPLGWQPAPFPGLEDMYQVTGADGRTYYVRGTTNQAYVNMPIDVPVGAEFHFTDLIGPDGKIIADYAPVRYNGMLALTGPGVDYNTARRIAQAAFSTGEMNVNDYLWLNTMGIPLDHPSLPDVFTNFTPPASYFSGAYHEDRRRNYETNAKSYYENARREQAKARDARQEWLAAQSAAERRRPGFEEEYENVIAQSLEIAKRRTGIRFGSDGAKKPLGFSQPERPIEEVAEPILQPVTIDALKPPAVVPPRILPGVDDTPRTQVSQPYAPPKPATTTKKKSAPGASPGGGGGARSE